MTISKISTEELRAAKKAGFKKKKPRKPKQSASLNSMENWVVRYNLWIKDAKDKAKEGKKRETLKSQIRGART